jgi:Rrf2 family nitric oxide-sensitive transcriptional repressor
VRAVEEDFTMVECFDTDSNQCVITGACRLRGALTRALKAYFAVLDEYTLADLAGRNPVLARVLKAS